ncbi:hypothetical protein, partial [Thiolapillus sp.]|uniref:hypothetical protein n=1 Tax=Thiolapillus sp. TaxID=2017437 RepID=UPI003AF83E3C
LFSLWRKARRENSAASRLLGSTSLRFALHGWQRYRPADGGLVRIPKGMPGGNDLAAGAQKKEAGTLY